MFQLLHEVIACRTVSEKYLRKKNEAVVAGPCSVAVWSCKNDCVNVMCVFNI